MSSMKSLARFFVPCPFSAENQPQNLERIADELLSLTKLERHDPLQTQNGSQQIWPSNGRCQSVSISAGRAGGSCGGEDCFDIKLEKFDAASKIKIIKEVRSFSDLGLKEAKDLVEKVPVVVEKGVSKEEANPIIEKLKDLGATVVLE